MSFCFGRRHLPVQHKNSFASSFSTQTMNAHTNAALYGPVRFASMRAFLAVLLGRPISLYLRSEDPELSRCSSYQPGRPLDLTAGDAHSNSVASSLLSLAFRLRPNPTNSISWKFVPLERLLKGAQKRSQATGRSSRANSRGRLCFPRSRQQRYRSQICFAKLGWSLHLYE